MPPSVPAKKTPKKRAGLSSRTQRTRVGTLWPKPGPNGPTVIGLLCGDVARRGSEMWRYAGGCGRAPRVVGFTGAAYGTEGHRFESCRARSRKPRSGGVFLCRDRSAVKPGAVGGTWVGAELV